MFDTSCYNCKPYFCERELSKTISKIMNFRGFTFGSPYTLAKFYLGLNGIETNCGIAFYPYIYKRLLTVIIVFVVYFGYVYILQHKLMSIFAFLK